MEILEGILKAVNSHTVRRYSRSSGGHRTRRIVTSLLTFVSGERAYFKGNVSVKKGDKLIAVVESVTDSKIKDMDFEILAYRNVTQNKFTPTFGELLSSAFIAAIFVVLGIIFLGNNLIRLLQGEPFDLGGFILAVGFLGFGSWLIRPDYKRFLALRKLKNRLRTQEP